MSRIGKLIGGCLYVHRQYQNEIPAAVLSAARRSTSGFLYDVVKWDTKTNNVTFVQCPTFDTLPEPVMGAALMVRPDGTSRFMKPLADPWVYHHKYAFVGPDYRGFNLDTAKRRQQAIDRIPDVDKSRIGKYSVNAAVTRSLSGIEHETNPVDRTSRNQLPAVFKQVPWTPGTRNSDIGGGKYEKANVYLRERNVENLIYDPFSRPTTYKAVGKKLERNPGDTGTLANVLNVIEQRSNRIDVLKVLAMYTKAGAPVYIGIYEKDGDGRGAHTSDGTWQNNLKTVEYMPEVLSVFPDARKVKDGLIVATSPGPRGGLAGLAGAQRFSGRSVADWKRIQRDSMNDVHPDNQFTGGDYGDGSQYRKGPKPVSRTRSQAQHYFAYLEQEYNAYPAAYQTQGELNLTAMAEWLEDNFDESLTNGQDASEIVFEWAEAMRPEGYEPMAEVLSRNKGTTRKFQVGQNVFTSAGMRGKVHLHTSTGYIVRLPDGREFEYNDNNLTAAVDVAPAENSLFREGDRVDTPQGVGIVIEVVPLGKTPATSIHREYRVRLTTNAVVKAVEPTMSAVGAKNRALQLAKAKVIVLALAKIKARSRG